MTAIKFCSSSRIESGGRAFFPYRADDLAESFTDIGTELRSQYFIAYSPANSAADGRYRKIDVADGSQRTDRTHAQGLLRRPLASRSCRQQNKLKFILKWNDALKRE